MRPRYHPVNKKIKGVWIKAENAVWIGFLVVLAMFVVTGMVYLYKRLRKPKKSFYPKLPVSPIVNTPEIITKSPRTKNTSKDDAPPPLELSPISTSDKNKRQGETEKTTMPKNSIRTAEIVSKLNQVKAKKAEERIAQKISRMNKPAKPVKEIKVKPRLINPVKKVPVAVKPINPRITKVISYIDKSATYLVNFKFEEIPTNNLMKLLAFLFNFHRYNLESKVLAKNKGAIVLRCLSLRTSLVHSAQQTHLDEAIVLTTQAMMKTFLFQEVINLVKSHTKDHLVPPKLLPAFFEVVSDASFDPTDYSIQDTPLYKAFDYQKANMGDIINEHTFIDDKLFYRWMKFEVVPCMNALITAMDTHRDEALDAFRMLIIIFGEYCNDVRAIRIKTLARSYSGNSEDEPRFMKELVTICRRARNHLAHELDDLDNQTINNISVLAFNINQNIGSLNAIKSILTPPTETSPLLPITSAPRP